LQVLDFTHFTPKFTKNECPFAPSSLSPVSIREIRSPLCFTSCNPFISRISRQHMNRITNPRSTNSHSDLLATNHQPLTLPRGNPGSAQPSRHPNPFSFLNR
jgi:hypothetical protein